MLTMTEKHPHLARKPEDHLQPEVNADYFFFKVLLPQIKVEEKQNIDFIYFNLQQFRRSQKVNLNLSDVYSAAHAAMIVALSKIQLGQTPALFFEISKAFTLISNSISQTDSFFAEFQTSQPSSNDHLSAESFRKKVQEETEVIRSQLNYLLGPDQ